MSRERLEAAIPAFRDSLLTAGNPRIASPELFPKDFA